ncbi:MAG: putative DNA-binding protein, partial [Clostridia bacterium]|nr:putative DNA-binding protein [Clostridia bacterium]
MDKFSFITLWDRYRGLLTLTQQEITDLYFNLDLTLSEIADEKGITRQGVSECLKTSKKQLEEYEEKLGFCRA